MERRASIRELSRTSTPDCSTRAIRHFAAREVLWYDRAVSIVVTRGQSPHRASKRDESARQKSFTGLGDALGRSPFFFGPPLLNAIEAPEVEGLSGGTCNLHDSLAHSLA